MRTVAPLLPIFREKCTSKMITNDRPVSTGYQIFPTLTLNPRRRDQSGAFGGILCVPYRASIARLSDPEETGDSAFFAIRTTPRGVRGLPCCRFNAYLAAQLVIARACSSWPAPRNSLCVARGISCASRPHRIRALPAPARRSSEHRANQREHF